MTFTDEEIRALCEQATEGPWWANEPGQCCQGPCITNEHGSGIHGILGILPKDQAFIAAARSLVPSLLDRAQAAERALDALHAYYETEISRLANARVEEKRRADTAEVAIQRVRDAVAAADGWVVETAAVEAALDAPASQEASGFYERDEPVVAVLAAYEAGEKGVTAPPSTWSAGGTVEVTKPFPPGGE
jgi:hypothetical protein